jgi:hypothetical protein
MNRSNHRLVATAFAALTLASGATFAQTHEDMSFAGMMAMSRVDMNKDGMVSKKEFLDTMAKVWDERAKKAKMSADKMSADDFNKMVLMYLKAGG